MLVASRKMRKKKSTRRLMVDDLRRESGMLKRYLGALVIFGCVFIGGKSQTLFVNLASVAAVTFDR